jgi:hypothetical protein
MQKIKQNGMQQKIGVLTEDMNLKYLPKEN